MFSAVKKALIHTQIVTIGLITYLPLAHADDGGGIFGPIPPIGGASGDPRGTITNILKTILGYMALVAVIVIVLAGIRMVVSMGDEGAVDKAKKTLLYAIIGLIIILLASAIVTIIASFASGGTAP